MKRAATTTDRDDAIGGGNGASDAFDKGLETQAETTPAQRINQIATREREVSTQSTQPETKKPRKRPPPSPPPVVSPSAAASSQPQLDASMWDAAMLLVDKPKTWTSFDVCGKIRGELGRALNVKPKKIKVGHAGTLDPMATGLLIVCVGKGTKSIDTLMGMPKEYSGTMKLGEATDSYDADGKVVSSHEWEHTTIDQLEGLVREKFLGEIQQVPPMFSALKQGGKKLCDLAREGKEVAREARTITVERYDLTSPSSSSSPSSLVDYYVRCSKGTYIRCLAHDLGQAAGCGAHLVALRREKIGEFDVQNAWQVDDLVAFIKRFGVV